MISSFASRSASFLMQNAKLYIQSTLKTTAKQLTMTSSGLMISKFASKSASFKSNTIQNISKQYSAHQQTNVP
jgi:hypothetical protein